MMKPSPLFLFLWALMPLLTHQLACAQSHNPAASVPSSGYQSAFSDLPDFDPERPASDRKDWRKANDAVTPSGQDAMLESLPSSEQRTQQKTQPRMGDKK